MLTAESVENANDLRRADLEARAWENFWASDLAAIFSGSDFDNTKTERDLCQDLGRKVYNLYWADRREFYGV